jgi:LAGLIDADG endonuclease
MRSVRAISRKGSKMLDVKSIPPEIGWYLAGFVDGEGSFNVSFRPRPDYKVPWKVSLCFNISQRDPVILSFYKKYLECGTMRQRRDGVWYYEVNNLNAIVANVIPFFERFGFLSAKKKRDFAKFKELTQILVRGGHQSEEGIRRVLEIRRDMNDGGKRRYLEAGILQSFENPQRLYAGPLGGDETVRTARRRAEPGGNDLAPSETGVTKDERS